MRKQTKNVNKRELREVSKILAVEAGGEKNQVLNSFCENICHFLVG